MALETQEKPAQFSSKQFDSKEIKPPETVFVRDIENKVFQTIILQALSRIKGIALIEGNFIDNFLGRDSVEGVKGIYAEQDQHNHSVAVKVEINICYGLAIPQKAEEIQTLIAEEITKMTGLHVACVHAVFKNVVLQDPTAMLIPTPSLVERPSVIWEKGKNEEEEFSDEL